MKQATNLSKNDAVDDRKIKSKRNHDDENNMADSTAFDKQDGQFESQARDDLSVTEHASQSNTYDPGAATSASAGEGVGDRSLSSTTNSESATITDQIQELEQKITELEDEKKQLKNSILRGLADAENTRKRLKKLHQENVYEKISDVLMDVVLVFDDFERARNAMNTASDSTEIAQGLALVEKNLQQVLASKWNLNAFDSIGQNFDPERHEAISREEDAKAEESTVVEVYQKGYMLGERVLRPAKVKVLSPKDKQT